MAFISFLADARRAGQTRDVSACRIRRTQYSGGTGATWKKAVDRPKGGEVFIGSYDPVGDVLYAQTGSIFRYAR